MTDIKWQEPPADGRLTNGRSARWAAVAAALRERPDEWALIAEGTTDVSLTRRIKTGYIKAFQPDGSFDATSRMTTISGNKREYDVYVKFIGEAGEHA